MGRKKNQKLWNQLTKNLNDFKIEAGWFENTKYDDGTPVGKIAAIQNYGGVAHNPGGQPYYIDGKTGLAVFLSKNSVTGRYYTKIGQVTKPHYITIPPRPFMDNAKDRLKEEGQEILMQEMLRVFEGRQTMEQATNRLGIWLQGIIQEEITKLQNPALKRSTVRQREKQYDSKGKGGTSGINKPLVDTGIMLNTVQYQVTKK